jgi:hypothetical protein
MHLNSQYSNSQDPDALERIIAAERNANRDRIESGWTDTKIPGFFESYVLSFKLSFPKVNLFQQMKATGNTRLLSKLACSDEVPGAFGAQRMSVYLILDDARTEETTQFASEVEFRKKSTITNSFFKVGTAISSFSLRDAIPKGISFSFGKNYVGKAREAMGALQQNNINNTQVKWIDSGADLISGG